jgi:hypothetical protein
MAGQVNLEHRENIKENVMYKEEFMVCIMIYNFLIDSMSP